MKKFMMIIVMMVTIVSSASAMTYSQSRKEALFLTDKMAYELNLTNAQYDAVYEVNLDYLMSLSTHSDLYGNYWNRRNYDLQYILTVSQYNRYIGANYFYRPVYRSGNSWAFYIYSRYTNKKQYYRSRPTIYSSYKGGHNKGTVSHYVNSSFYNGSYKHSSTNNNNTHFNANVNTNRPQVNNNNNSNKSFGNGNKTNTVTNKTHNNSSNSTYGSNNSSNHFGSSASNSNRNQNKTNVKTTNSNTSNFGGRR